AFLPHGRADARDRKRLHQARGPGHRHTPRAGGGDDGPRVQPRDPAPRRLYGLLGTGDDQSRDGRRQRLRRRRPADRRGRVGPGPAGRAPGAPGATAAAVALLGRAERPLVIGGSGVWWSDAASAFQAFVDTTGIPFYTTPISRGMVAEDHGLAFLNARARAFAE